MTRYLERFNRARFRRITYPPIYGKLTFDFDNRDLTTLSKELYQSFFRIEVFSLYIYLLFVLKDVCKRIRIILVY